MRLYMLVALVVNHPFAVIKLNRVFNTPVLVFYVSSRALTVFQRRRIDLSTGRACPGSIESLDHDPILGKLLEVVQGVDFTVPCSFHLHDAVLAVAAWTIFPVTDLVASDNPVL